MLQTAQKAQSRHIAQTLVELFHQSSLPLTLQQIFLHFAFRPVLGRSFCHLKI